MQHNLHQPPSSESGEGQDVTIQRLKADSAFGTAKSGRNKIAVTMYNGYKATQFCGFKTSLERLVPLADQTSVF